MLMNLFQICLIKRKMVNSNGLKYDASSMKHQFFLKFVDKCGSNSNTISHRVFSSCFRC